MHWILKDFKGDTMTIFKDYSQNGKLLSVRDEPLTQQNFPRYIEEHGEERARGYQDAAKDILKQLNQLVYHYERNGITQIRTVAGTQTRLIDFFNERQGFVEALKEILPDSDESSQPDAKTKLTP